MENETREELNHVYGQLQAMLREASALSERLSTIDSDDDLSSVIDCLDSGDIDGASVAISNLLAG